MNLKQQQLLAEVEGIVIRTDKRDDALKAISELLVRKVNHYDWVGFYLVETPGSQELVLGPYEGSPTEHVQISFGEGICGQAADTGTTFIVQDVSQETNYLSCSPEVKSEVVVPIFKGDTFVGELDIDSHELAPFTDDDNEFLEAVCDAIVPLF
jgi:GAF domain-containing protein